MKTYWLFGLPSSGKTTIGRALVYELQNQGVNAYLLDGDELRQGLCINVGYTMDARYENVRRAAEVAKILNHAGVTVVATFITPAERLRKTVRYIVEDVSLVWVNTPLSECVRRDVKGLYKKARQGKLKNMTGIDSEFEVPQDVDIVIQDMTIEGAVEKILIG